MEPPLPSSPDTQDNEPSLTRRSSRSSVTSNEPTLTRRRSSSTTSSVDPSEIASTKFESPFDATLAAARKRSQHEKLWEMFATYALQMSSEDPTRMRVNVVVKLLQDCGVIDASNSEEAKMIEKEVKIVCDSFLKNVSSDRDVTKRMDFTAFLKLLMHFAEMSDGQDPARAYDSLVRTCLEKQQKPRVRVSVTMDMQECKKVLQAFDEPLSKIFALYAGASHTKLEKLDPKMAQISPPHMGYGECLAFARKYGVIAHGLLTTTEFSTIYIDSLAKAPMNEYERVLTYEGFGELMVRLSRKACRGEHLTPEKRLKGLFQLMWLASSSTSPRALQITDVLKSNRVDVTKLFLLHFEKFWRKENYENYMGDRCLHDTEDMEPTTNPDGTIPPPAPTSTNSTKRRISLCVQSNSTPNITTSSPIIIATSTKIATSPTKSATNSPSTQSPSKRQSVNPGSAGKTPTKIPVRRATMQTNIIS